MNVDLEDELAKQLKSEFLRGYRQGVADTVDLLTAGVAGSSDPAVQKHAQALREAARNLRETKEAP